MMIIFAFDSGDVPVKTERGKPSSRYVDDDR